MMQDYFLNFCNTTTYNHPLKEIHCSSKQTKNYLNPLKLEVNAKTVGSKLKVKEKTIELESIKTRISINSLISGDFSLKNLDISTRSLNNKFLD